MQTKCNRIVLLWVSLSLVGFLTLNHPNSYQEDHSAYMTEDRFKSNFWILEVMKTELISLWNRWCGENAKEAVTLDSEIPLELTKIKVKEMKKESKNSLKDKQIERGQF
jgi:hypothetical protein